MADYFPKVILTIKAVYVSFLYFYFDWVADVSGQYVPVAEVTRMQ